MNFSFSLPNPVLPYFQTAGDKPENVQKILEAKCSEILELKKLEKLLTPKNIF